MKAKENDYSSPAVFTCSKLIMERQEQYVKSTQS